MSYAGCLSYKPSFAKKSICRADFNSSYLLVLWRVASPFRIIHEELCSVGARHKKLVVADADLFQGGFCLLKIMYSKGCSHRQGQAQNAGWSTR